MTTTPVPAPATTAAARGGGAPQLGRRLGQGLRDLGYLLSGLPVALLIFVLLVAGLHAAASATPSLVAIPLAVAVLFATLFVARWAAALERRRLGWVGARIAPPVRVSWSRGAPGRGVRGTLARAWAWLRDPQQWLDLVHGLVAMPLALVTWTLTVAWTAGALGGLTAWAWAPPLSHRVVESVHVGFPVTRTALDALLGAALLLTLVPVLRGLTLAHVGLGRALLGSQRVRALEERVVVLDATRRAAAEAEAQSFATLERDLHDGPQQRLVRLDMDLAAAQRRLAAGEADAAVELVGSARTQAVEALAELRHLARGIASPVLADRGLAAALAHLAARCPVPTTTSVELDPALPGERLPVAPERAAYFVVAEALANAAKHSGARSARVDVSAGGAVGPWLVVRVEDDGVGGAHVGKGHGLAGLEARCAALDGTLRVASPAGGPTVLTARIPLAGDEPA